MAMTMDGRNRIMIYGPKADGTYVVEFKMARRRGVGDLNPKNRDGGDPALSRANALRTVRAGRVLYFRG
jgi:hypothetical protein